MKRAFGETAIFENVDIIKQDIQMEKKEVTKFMRDLEGKTKRKLDQVKQTVSLRKKKKFLLTQIYFFNRKNLSRRTSSVNSDCARRFRHHWARTQK
jgi:hypothetical protein